MENTPVLIHLQANQNSEAFLHPNTPRFFLGDLKETVLLRHYQIPTVSLGSIIYPLSYRYHQNMGVAYRSSFYGQTQFNKTNIDNEGTQQYTNEYGDKRYDNNQGGLRYDIIHPPHAGAKWIASLLSYLFVTEDRLIATDLNTFDLSADDLKYKNKVWITPDVQSLPPALYLHNDTHLTPVFQLILDEQMRLIKKIAGEYNISYATDVYISYRMYLFDSTVFKQKRGHYHKVVMENEGFMIQAEASGNQGRAKWGLVCDKVYGLISIRPQLHSWILNDTKRFAIIRPKVVTIQYLVSYENMGCALIWIDGKPQITRNIMDQVESITDGSGVLVDGLIKDRISVANAVNIAIPDHSIDLRKDDLYVHLVVMPSEPQREHNKFKLLSLTLYV